MIDHLKRYPVALITNTMLTVVILAVIMLDDIIGVLMSAGLR